MQVKGLLLDIEREALRALEAAGRSEAGEAWRGLPEADRRVLDGPLASAQWYELRLHEALVAALTNATAPNGGLRASGGHRAAERLLEDAESRGLGACLPPGPGWERAGPLLVAIPSRLLSETSWRLVPGDQSGRFAVEVRGADTLSEASRGAAEVLLEGLATRLMGLDVEVRSERPAAGTVVFHGRPLRS